MLELTFGEQVKVVLSRKGMTIKEFAEIIEEQTGKKMSRQNLTQRLARDNFQEQDMRMIAGILGCPLYLSILEDGIPAGEAGRKTAEEKITEEKIAEEQVPGPPREMKSAPSESEGSEDAYTVDELLAEIDALESEVPKESAGSRAEKEKRGGWEFRLHRNKKREQAQEESVTEERDVFQEMPVEDVFHEDVLVGDILSDEIPDEEEDMEHGDVNPYTGREYKTNSVRIHPERIGYVQVYDRAGHKWTDMTEWAFLGYQERKKALLGNDYEPPIYLD